MSQLHFTMVQASLVWEDAKANHAHFDQLLSDIEQTDVIVLPEMFSTGFSMNPESLAENESGVSVSWMQELAKRSNAAVTGSLIIREDSKYYNRLFWVLPSGDFTTYDKRHLFSLAGEEKHYAAGNERVLIEYKGFRIMPLVCYDLRFPVWSRNDLNYDVAIYVANWPERRSYYWKQLLIARAIENQSYVIGVNRVGNDGNEIYHSGDSICLDPLAAIVSSANAGKEEVFTAVIDKDRIAEVRDKFQFLNDQDNFDILTRN